MKVSIVIPCYNEGDTILLLLERFDEVVGDRDLEVVLVNNGSSDWPVRAVECALKQYRFLKTVTVPVNHGYGYGILKGLREADGDYIGWTHGDLQTDPGDVARAYDILKKQKAGNLFLKGCREGRPFSSRLLTAGMGLFESMYFGMKLTDINAQPNLFPKWFLKSWDRPPYDFSLDLYALYMANQMGLRVVRFPVAFPERVRGISKWDTGWKAKWGLIRRTISFSRRLKHRNLPSVRGK